MLQKGSHFRRYFYKISISSINKIPDETFEDLHSLEWLKLWNNELASLSYSLMEPVLDTLKHLDIHSNTIQYNSVLSRVACLLPQAIPWYATVKCDGTGNGTTTAGKMWTRIISETQSARIQLTGELVPSLRLV